MKASTIAAAVIWVIYIIVFCTVLSATVKAYGSDSMAFVVVVIGVGTIGCWVLATHKGLDDWIKGWDR